MLNFIASCEFVGQLGGAFFLEHPEDLEVEPAASIFNTDIKKNGNSDRNKTRKNPPVPFWSGVA